MKRNDWILILSIVVTAAIWIGLFRFVFGPNLEPPASVTSFSEFLAWQSPPEHLLKFTKEDQEYLLVQGPSRGVLESGPSAYVFDRAGIVDWSEDYGDDNEFDRKWHGSSDSSRVTPEEATAFIQATTRAR